MKRSVRTAALTALCIAGALLAGCGGGPDPVQASADRGRVLIEREGCGMCHSISGVERANGNVGPSLEDFAAKPGIAGKLPNNPDAAVAWLMNPQATDPATLMPNLGLSPEEARAITDYLYKQ